MTTASVENRIKLSPIFWKRIIRRIFSWLLLFVPKYKIDKKLLTVFKRYDSDNTNLISSLTLGGKKKNYLCALQKSKNFTDLIEMEFCGRFFFCPRNYDEILQKHFGDYMKLPPLNERVPNHGIKVIQL